MKIHDLQPFLAEHPFFRGMEERHLALMAGCAANVHFEAGDSIFRQGEPADRFYVIRSGRVSLSVPSPAGEDVQVRTLGAGDVLGWAWLFPPYVWHYDARCTEHARTVALDGKCLRGKCDADHDLGYALMLRFSSMIVDRLQATTLQLMDMYGRD